MTSTAGSAPARGRAAGPGADPELPVMDADPALDGLVRAAAALTGMRCASVITMDTAVMRVMAVHGFRGASWPRDGSVVATVLARGPGAQTCDDLATETQFARSPWLDGRRGRMRAFGCAPVVLDGVLLAAVCVFDDAPHSFTDAERSRLTDVATAVAALVRAAQQARELADLAAATQLAHTETARAHAELARSTAFTRALLEVLPVGVIGGDAEGRVTLFNATAREWHGLDADPTVALEDIPRAFGLTDVHGAPVEYEDVPFRRVYTEGRVDDAEMGIALPGRSLRRVCGSGAQVRDDDGALLGIVVTLTDVTEQRALEAALRDAALHDPLTGLPNRNLLLDRLDQSLAAAERAHRPMAVLYCDLDGFKPVNDTAGHAAGDEVLVAAAGRLAAAVRPGDTVARIGGDEFVVLCPEAGSEQAAQVIADRITAAFDEPLRRGNGDEHAVGISIGLALCGPGETPDSALAASDAAMYRVKAARRGARVPTPRPVTDPTVPAP
ncbi:diguanylate cyclase domain-containing protein [Blastococcus xanthinilyticus]|uniref:Diguanylate cyclase (GGDEF)-like protein n=1 Tax=Blastococcus xanthinilyticus TaxID=1564164 RepID=A0A5S5CQI6_9ACTN|nr:diguanylate cyclase [Blastococcus xanthinilyticus]TYP83792.1 diguanylate cyclase (GGDEF)-like protein [Blastococcus xanthinilyticus]